MLASTTALAERAGRGHSSEWVISRTGTTLAACQANMPSTCRGDACPWQVSSSPTVRQASMWTPTGGLQTLIAQDLYGAQYGIAVKAVLLL